MENPMFQDTFMSDFWQSTSEALTFLILVNHLYAIVLIILSFYHGYFNLQGPGIITHWRGHQASPTVVSLKGRLSQKL